MIGRGWATFSLGQLLIGGNFITCTHNLREIFGTAGTKNLHTISTFGGAFIVGAKKPSIFSADLKDFSLRVTIVFAHALAESKWISFIFTLSRKDTFAAN